jgi:hypothetical protein
MVTPPSYFASGITARIQKLDAGCRRLGANSFHEKVGRSQNGFVFLSVDPNLFTEPPLSPSFHPQSLMSDGRSLQGETGLLIPVYKIESPNPQPSQAQAQ